MEETQHHITHGSPGGKNDQMKNYIIVALATALLVLGIVWVRDSWTSKSTDTAAAPIIPNAPAPGAPPSNVQVNLEGAPMKGDKNAPVTIIEFSDYQCPFCGRFFQQTLPQLEAAYVTTGKVKLYFKDFPLDSIHPEATPAALAARCAGEQDKYWEMHDKIFANQQSISNANYKRWAADLGLDTTQFNQCLDSQKYLGSVRQDLVDGQRAGVQGTPAFLVNGQLISGAQPFSAFQPIIEAALAR